MRTEIFNANIVLKDGVLNGGVCAFTDGVIDYVGVERVRCDQSIDAMGNYLLAGFIDIHCHGGNGYDFMDASFEEFNNIANFHLSHGTTTLLATTMASSKAETERALDTFDKHKRVYPNSTLIGVHMEGPWFSPEGCGAQPTEFFLKPKKEQIYDIKQKYPFVLRVSAAPELDDEFEFGKACRELNVVCSVAHTGADFSTIERAKDNGYSLMTHLYSGMNGVHRKNAYRIAGAVEAGLYFDQLDVEIIADGKHLPVELLRFIYKCKGKDKICLITDGTRASGFSDGKTSVTGSIKNGTPCIVEDGVAKVLDRTGFAGSVATADRLVKTMLSIPELSIVEVSRMASLNPARVMGFNDRGQIAVGLRADLVICDKDINIKKVIYSGKTV